MSCVAATPAGPLPTTRARLAQTLSNATTSAFLLASSSRITSCRPSSLRSTYLILAHNDVFMVLPD
jgi:hypothetical protein